MPIFHMFAFRLAQRVRTIVMPVELRVEVTRLKSKHGAKRRHVGRKAAVTTVDVIAVGDGCRYGAIAYIWNSGRKPIADRARHSARYQREMYLAPRIYIR